MDEKLKKIYVPMTETAFYILLSLQKERHGYGISQRIRKLTRDHVRNFAEDGERQPHRSAADPVCVHAEMVH